MDLIAYFKYTPNIILQENGGVILGVSREKFLLGVTRNEECFTESVWVFTLFPRKQRRKRQIVLPSKTEIGKKGVLTVCCLIVTLSWWNVFLYFLRDVLRYFRDHCTRKQRIYTQKRGYLICNYFVTLIVT